MFAAINVLCFYRCVCVEGIAGGGGGDGGTQRGLRRDGRKQNNDVGFFGKKQNKTSVRNFEASRWFHPLGVGGFECCVKYCFVSGVSSLGKTKIDSLRTSQVFKKINCSEWANYNSSNEGKVCNNQFKHFS